MVRVSLSVLPHVPTRFLSANDSSASLSVLPHVSEVDRHARLLQSGRVERLGLVPVRFTARFASACPFYHTLRVSSQIVSGELPRWHQNPDATTDTSMPLFVLPHASCQLVHFTTRFVPASWHHKGEIQLSLGLFGPTNLVSPGSGPPQS